MSEKILFVDDEESILAGYRRTLRGRFDLDTALGPEEGLKAVEGPGGYAVVVSDLRMPGMGGIGFLARVRERSPDTVRIMLTGHADVEAAMAAVNEGNIFRFLTKPVVPDLLVRALHDSLHQYHLVTAERVLLEKTLAGSVKVLTEVLSVVNPMAFSRAVLLKRYVRHMAESIGAKDLWQYELAAMLSQIGCVALAPETIEKIYAGQELTEEEQKAFASHPEIGRSLLANIPRLEAVAQMIAAQHAPLNASSTALPPGQRDPVTLGAQLISIAVEFDKLVAHGTPPRTAIAQLRHRPDRCDPLLLAALETLDLGFSDMELHAVLVNNLLTSMIIAQDVYSKNGILLVGKGQEVTVPVMERLRRFSQGIGIEEPIRVLLPRNLAQQKP